MTVAYARAEKAKASRRAYHADFALFAQWCERRGSPALGAAPALVAAFLAEQVDMGKRPATLTRRLAAITTGKVFRGIDRHGRVLGPLTAQSVALIVKRHAENAGLDASVLAGHPLRAGFLTSAAETGADVLVMMKVSRHRRVETLQGYVRRANLFKRHVGEGLL